MTTTTRLEGAENTPTIPAIETAIPVAYPARLKRTDAVTLLEKTLIEFGQEADAFLASGRSGARPSVAIAGEAGLGKTRSVLGFIKRRQKRNPEERILYAVPSTDLGEELLKAATEDFGLNARIMRGRSQPRPDDPSQTMCAKSDIAETLATLNMSVSDSLCRKTLDDGSEVECPFAASCPYLAQLAEAKRGGLIIASHQYLSVRLEALKDIDLVVVDESFWQSLTFDKRLPLDRFMTLRLTGEAFSGRKNESKAQFEERKDEGDYELQNAIELFRGIVRNAEWNKRQPTLGEFRAAGFTTEHCAYLKGLEYSRLKPVAIHPGMDYAEQLSRVQKAEVQEVYSFARVWTILGDELAQVERDDAAPLGLDIEIGHLNPKTNTLENNLRMMWSRDPRFKDAPTIYIDADAAPQIADRFYPGIRFVEIRAEWRNVTVTQVHDWTGSATSLKGDRRKDDGWNIGVDMADRLSDMIGNDPAKKVAFITQKAVIDSWRKAGFLDDAPFNPLWFGNTRGKDGCKSAAGIVILGRIEASVDAIQAMTRGLFYKMARRLTLIDIVGGNAMMPTVRLIVTAKDGTTQEVETPRHPDELCDLVRKQVSVAELMQAVARVRPVHRSAEVPCEVLIVSKVPLPIQPDRLVSFASVAPDRFDKMRLAGIIPEVAQDVADAFPGMFASAGAVRTAASRRVERAFPAFEGRAGGVTDSFYISKGECNGWVRVSYERPLKVGTRGGAMWVLVERGDTEASITARVKGYLPDVHDISVAMPAPIRANASEATKTAPQAIQQPQAKRDPATNALIVNFSAIALAQATAEEQPWWTYCRPRHRNNFTERRAA